MMGVCAPVDVVEVFPFYYSGQCDKKLTVGYYCDYHLDFLCIVAAIS